MSKIADLQLRIAAVPDGFWGPVSIAAVQKHLRALAPKVNPWPSSKETSLRAFYGEPGDESNLVRINLGSTWIMHTDEGAKTITSTRCHRKVASSLTRIFENLSALGYNRSLSYDGCFNDRPMRGGTRKSTHAWGIAVDIDAANNGNLTPWPVRAKMPIEVMEVFAKEGWISAGAFWGRDAMHFQATQ